MLKKFSVIGAAGVLAIAALAGCSSDDKKDDTTVTDEVVATEEQSADGQSGEAQSGATVAYVTDNNLVGEYELVDLSVEGNEKDVSEYTLTDPVVLIINEDGSVNGQVCNTFNSTITEDGETGIATSTQMYCEEPADIMEVEDLVLGTFEGTVNPTDEGIVLIGTNGNQSTWKLVDVVSAQSE